MALYRSPVSYDLLLCHDQPPYYVRGTWVLKLLIGNKVSTELWVLQFLKRRYLKAFLLVTKATEVQYQRKSEKIKSQECLVKAKKKTEQQNRSLD